MDIAGEMVLLVSLLVCMFAPLMKCASPLLYHILEPGSPGEFVGNVVTNSFISENYTPEVVRTLRFELLNAGPRQSLFDLNDSTGILKLVDKVDREQICPRLEVCEIRLDIAVQPAKYFHVIKVTVVIDDINDYAPLFLRSNITYTVSETTAPGVLFPLITATDLDSPVYGIQDYELHGDANNFGLILNKLGDDEVDLRLELKQPLDRERQAFYALQLQAYDGGRPSLTGSQNIIIQVLDANDNSPQFVRRTIELEVEENLPPNTVLARVEARDEDEGENSNILYSLEPKSDKSYGDTFRVDPTTGYITLIGALDYEKQSLYNLKVIAEDNGEFALSATALVVVNVKDENDNRPIISVNSVPRPPTDTALVRIVEHEPPDSMVALVSVEDADSLENGHVECEIQGTDKENFRLEQILPNEYKLTTKLELDREVNYQYYIDVQCRDHGVPSLDQVVNIRVHVTDINDHTPVFTHSEYVFVIEENNNLDDFIGIVSASDADYTSNAQVRYEFCGQEPRSRRKIASLDERTGVLTAQAYFDREIEDRYELCIRASDMGLPPRNSTARVIVSIADQNDNPPVFNQSAYFFFVTENQPANTVVGQVQAYDRDLHPHDEFSFSFNNGGNYNFKIDSKSGVIVTLRDLDREVRDLYKVEVLVQSDNYPAFDMCYVTIRVEDLNDNAPVIHFPNSNSTTATTIEVSNKVPVGFEIAQIFATDDDLGNNSALTYRLPGTQNEFFSVNPRTGKIFTVKSLLEIELHTFGLHIEVDDKGQVPKLSYTKLDVLVNSSILYPYPTQTENSASRHPDLQLLLIASGSALVFILLVIILVVFCVILIKRARKSGKEYYIAEQNDHDADNQKPPAKHGNGTIKRAYGPHDEYESQDMVRTMTISKDDEDDVEPVPPLSNYGSMTSMPNTYDTNGGLNCDYSNGSPSGSRSNPWIPITTRPQYQTSPRPREPPAPTLVHNRHVTFTPISEREEMSPRKKWELTHSGSGTFV